jgi:hypothetical protein
MTQFVKLRPAFFSSPEFPLPAVFDFLEQGVGFGVAGDSFCGGVPGQRAAEGP